MNLWLQPFAGGPPSQLTDFKQGGILRREWSRDGKQIAIVRGVATSDAVLISNFRCSGILFAEAHHIDDQNNTTTSAAH